ncbi:MAG: hypothetical protein RSB77_02215 [Bacilli bacterium]
MKVLITIKKVIIGLFSLVFFIFAIAMTILALDINKFGLVQIKSDTYVVIDEDIANENYKKGNLVVVRKHEFQDLQVGDELFSYKIKNKIPYISIGKIKELFVSEDTYLYENGEGYTSEYSIGKVVKIYPKLGTYYDIVINKWGFLGIIVIPVFFMFTYYVYSLIIEIKYNGTDLDEPKEKPKKPKKKKTKEEDEFVIKDDEEETPIKKDTITKEEETIPKEEEDKLDRSFLDDF